MNILDKYIGRTILYSTMVVFSVLLGLFTFFEFVDKLGDLGKANFGLLEAVKFVLLTVPRKVYELFPMAALLGTMLGLSSLAIDSELIAMRAAGVSLFRIVMSAVKIGFVFVILAALIGEFVAPASENLAQRGRAAALHVGVQQYNEGIWLRDGAAFVSVNEVLPDLRLSRVSIYDFDSNEQLVRQTDAESGTYEGSEWRLSGVSQMTLEAGRVVTRQFPTALWHSAIDPSVLTVFAVKPDSLSAWNLYRFIRHLDRNSQETRRYQLAFWYKLISPFTTAVMVILAVPFVFAQPRSAGMGVRLFLGIMLGLSFYVLNRGFGYFNLLHGFPPLFGAALPTLLFLLLALVLLRRVA
jgi:lipopolysaccharide export system permease protein